MPSQVLIYLLCSAVMFIPARGNSQACTPSKAPGWSVELRQLYADCSNSVRSPNGSIFFNIGPDERILVLKAGRPLYVSGDQELELPAVISWSPGSSGFFLNDGNGSGLSSRLRLFRIVGENVAETDRVESEIVRIYRDHNRCNSSSDNPNVYGVGWSADGKMIYAIAQSTVNAPCGEPSNYLGFIVNFETGKVKQVLLTQQFKSQFRQFLPEELR